MNSLRAIQKTALFMCILVLESFISISPRSITIPIIPNNGTFFGNSLISGWTYGIAASAKDKDYYYLISNYIKSLNPGFTSTRIGASSFEGITSSESIDSTIQSVFLNKLTGNEDLVSIQLGDNVNTPEKNTVFVESSLKLCKALRLKCPNARIVWMGMWFGTTEKYTAIQNACNQTGCKFISLSDLISSSTCNSVGNYSNQGLGIRTLRGVTNIVENSSTNITITFAVGGITYHSTLDVVSYSLTSGMLTYTSLYQIIDSIGVAIHPNNEGFRLIANRFLYQMKLTSDLEYYK